MERVDVELLAEHLEMRVTAIVEDFNHPDEKSTEQTYIPKVFQI